MNLSELRNRNIEVIIILPVLTYLKKLISELFFKEIGPC